MISRVLKEKLVQSDLAASVRFQVVLQNETQRFQDELRCLTQKYKHLEVQVRGDPETLIHEKLFSYFSFVKLILVCLTS
jgi:hypothetical protein